MTTQHWRKRQMLNLPLFPQCSTIFKSRDDVLTALIHLGYLAYDAEAREAYVPNEEVRTAFARAVKDTDWEPVVQAIQDSDKLLRATWNKDADLVAEGIDKVQSVGINYNKEDKKHSCRIEEWEQK